MPAETLTKPKIKKIQKVNSKNLILSPYFPRFSASSPQNSALPLGIFELAKNAYTSPAWTLKIPSGMTGNNKEPSFGYFLSVLPLGIEPRSRD